MGRSGPSLLPEVDRYWWANASQLVALAAIRRLAINGLRVVEADCEEVRAAWFPVSSRLSCEPINHIVTAITDLKIPICYKFIVSEAKPAGLQVFSKA